MDFLNWYDWIAPTTPYASIFFGLIFSVVGATAVWFNTKKWKTTSIAMTAGLAVTFIGVFLLNLIGFYG
ncbi:hypothetical protein [Bacillus sp. 2205SS5-2]|uniref:hypothetical protein n=1 Tax=Bacillus sp. 2205SS5-2 TaxID=3109031 RepID=UPI003004A74F